MNSPTFLLDHKTLCETFTDDVHRQSPETKSRKDRRVDERLQTETEITFGRKPASTHSDPARKHPDRPPLTSLIK